MAVDGGGNVYISDTAAHAIRKWTAASNTVATVVSPGLNIPEGVAVDGAGNVYFTDHNSNAIKELPLAFLDPTANWESVAAGSDVLPVVLPATANLLAPFAPTSDQGWLTITGITNGVVSFAFSANTGSTNRTAHITLLGQPIAITQVAPPVITGQPASITVCEESPAVFTAAAAGSNLVYQWQVSQDGGTTFTNISADATNASYTNMAATVADNGNQYQVVVSGGGVSVTSAPPAVLTVNAPPTAGAGANQTICAGGATAGLGGTVGGSATGGTWSSSGTGTFVPDANTLNATYVPSAADMTAGTVTLTLSTTGQLSPCGAATAQATITLAATASASGNQTICVGSATAGLGGTVGGSATGGLWTSSGTGSFAPSASALNATYTPSAADITAGGVTLTLTTTGQGASCPSATAQVVVTINAPPAITFSPASQTVLAGSSVTFSVGAAGPALTYQWQFNGTNLPSSGGIITTVAGNGGSGFSGDGGTAANTSLSYPAGVSVDGAGNLFIADTGNSRIRKVDTNGIITTVAGGGSWMFSGDGGAATNAGLEYPSE